MAGTVLSRRQNEATVLELLLAASPMAILGIVAVLVYWRTRVSAFLLMGIGAILICVATVSPGWLSPKVFTGLLLWSGFLCFGWGFARSRTIDSVAFRATLLRLPWNVRRAD